jgi:hypothetical protein
VKNELIAAWSSCCAAAPASGTCKYAIASKGATVRLIAVILAMTLSTFGTAGVLYLLVVR